MLDSTKLQGEAKMFKSGNSYGLRLTKKDKELLHADTDTIFEKVISPDGSTITYRKKPQVNPAFLDAAKAYYHKNESMMERLKDL